MAYRLITGNALEVLRTLPADSVHCCVTSPPYWGLRDYGTAKWVSGAEDCDHKVGTRGPATRRAGLLSGGKATVDEGNKPYGKRCGKCGARREDNQIGLEATPEAYVARLVAVFEEVRRVLRPDGTFWLNVGNSYHGGGPHHGDKNLGKSGSNKGSITGKDRTEVNGLKPKDLCGIPWRLAFALQAAGWWLRSDIIWHSPNKMPESVTDRPTKAHEYVFLLTKSAKYYYDADAVAEPHSRNWQTETVGPGYMKPEEGRNDGGKRQGNFQNPAGRNCRSVWSIPSEPTSEPHFATYPTELVKRCILAGTSAKGCCARCGAPWVRITEKGLTAVRPAVNGQGNGELASGKRFGDARRTEVGWEPGCTCKAPVVPCTVLDPFAGLATTGLVAQRTGRDFIGIELNPAYVKMAEKRLNTRKLSKAVAPRGKVAAGSWAPLL